MKEKSNNPPMAWYSLILGVLTAGIPAIGLFSKLGDPGLWPVHLAFSAVSTVTVFYMWKNTEGGVRVSWPAFLWLGLTAFAWAAPCFTELFSVAEWKFSAGRLTGYAGILLLGTLWQKDESAPLRAFFTFMLGFSLILSLHYVLTFLAHGVSAWEDPYLVSGLMGHKNFTVSAIALTVPLILLGRSRTYWPGYLSTTALIIGIGAILLAQTRSIWLGSALALFSAFILGWRPSGSFRWALFSGAGLVTLLILSPPVQKRLFDPANLEIRQVFWDHSFQMQAEHPLFGVGPGQWRIHFPKYGLLGMNPSVAEGVTSEVRPHNDFIWVLAEQGYVGVFLFASFFLLLFVQWGKSFKEKGKTLEGQVWLAVMVITLVYASFEFPLERAAFFAPFLFLVGLLSRGGIGVPKKVVLSLSALLLMMSIGISMKAIQADRANQVVLDLNSRKEASGIVRSATEAISSWNELDRLSNPVIYFAGMGSMFSEAQAQGQSPSFTEKNFTQAESFFNEALHVHPYHVVTWYQKANMYRYRGQLQEAKESYETLLRLSPRHPGGQLQYAVTLNALEEYEGAARGLVAAFLTEDLYRSPDYQRAVVTALRGMPEGIAHQGLRRFLPLRNQMADSQLFQAFQMFKMQQRHAAQSKTSAG